MSRWLALAEGGEIEKQTPPDSMTIPDKTLITQPEPAYCRVLSKCRVEVDGEYASPTQDPKANEYSHGTTFDGTPKTWTGKIVSLAAWHQLSEWEKHGPDGKQWNGISQTWEIPT